ncbi:unnamed protein product, partial [Prorocentrum cordatum]
MPDLTLPPPLPARVSRSALALHGASEEHERGPAERLLQRMEDHADAAEITDKRDKARNAEEGVQPGPDAQDAVLLDQCGVGFMLTTGQAYRGLELVPLDKLSWWPEAEGPGVTLNPDVEAVSLRFFNEVAREGWKKELSRRLGAEGTQWSRGWNRTEAGWIRQTIATSTNTTSASRASKASGVHVLRLRPPVQGP